jgi:hypothetical protein
MSRSPPKASRPTVAASGGSGVAGTGLVMHFTLPAETSPVTSAVPGPPDGAAWDEGPTAGLADPWHAVVLQPRLRGWSGLD